MGKREAKKFMQMRRDETDPDNIAILDLDIQRELGLDPEELKEGKKDSRHYDIFLVVEKTYKPLTEEYIKKIIKPFMDIETK